MSDSLYSFTFSMAIPQADISQAEILPVEVPEELPVCWASSPPFKVGTFEVASFEVGTFEVGSFEVGTRKAAG